MKTFLQEVAEKVYTKHPKLDDVTVVFPNRRAALYFRKHLSGRLTRPSFAPKILTIEDFIGGFSHLKVPDKLTLISILYGAYNTVNASEADADKETVGDLAQFYFWGEMLLRDFEELDK